MLFSRHVRFEYLSRRIGSADSPTEIHSPQRLRDHVSARDLAASTWFRWFVCGPSPLLHGRETGIQQRRAYLLADASLLPDLCDLVGRQRLNWRQTQTVELELGGRALSFYDPEQGDWVAEAGEFEVHVGASSRDLRQSGSFWLKAQ